MDKNIYKELKALGNKIDLPSNPDLYDLEVVANPHYGTFYNVRFTCPEFTSLCPITSQPDFAYIVLDYIPDKFIVESKSLKLYLHSFRNHQAFHEACSIDIFKKLFSSLSPKWMRIAALWYPRGGIPIDIFYQDGVLPEGVFIPDLDVMQYKARF